MTGQPIKVTIEPLVRRHEQQQMPARRQRIGQIRNSPPVIRNMLDDVAANDGIDAAGWIVGAELLGADIGELEGATGKPLRRTCDILRIDVDAAITS